MSIKTVVSSAKLFRHVPRSCFARIHTRQYSLLDALSDAFIKLGLKAPKGKLMGEDRHGNKYFQRDPYEKDRNPKPKRWIERKISDDNISEPYLEEFDVPLEWRAWLQFKRHSPPTEAEIQRNIAMMNRTKMRALEVEQREAEERREMGLEPIDTLTAGDSEFPIYPEFEGAPKFGPKFTEGQTKSETQTITKTDFKKIDDK